LTRPFDKHLDSDELDGLVSLHAASVTDSGRLSEQALGEAQRHIESCQDCSRKVQMHKSVQSEISSVGAPSKVPPCPDCTRDVEWLEVAAGLLPETKTRELMKHAAQCGYCGPLLRNAAETLLDEASPKEEEVLAGLSSARPEWQRNIAETLRGNIQDKQLRNGGNSWWQRFFSWPRPAFAVAALAAVVVSGWLGSRVLRPPSATQLLAQAYTERRTLEVRISGAKYAPMRVERSAARSSLDRSPSLIKAEALISENLKKNPYDPTWLQAKARADLLDGNYESAVRSLQRALDAQPDSPALLTDLASAYFERAEAADRVIHYGTPSVGTLANSPDFARAAAPDRVIDYGNAVDALGKALAKSPDDPVALFNRALVSERIFLYTQAVEDWEHYSRIDPQGEWADEARKRLAALKEKLKQHGESQAEPLLEPSEIARAGTEDASVRAKIDSRIEQYLNLAVTDWLPSAYPTTRQTTTNVSNLRSALTILSEIATQKHADRWLADLLASASSPIFAPAVAQLSAALKANDIGDNVIARQNAAQAEQLFTAAGSDAGTSRARFEYLFASHDAQEGNLCLEAASRLAPRLKNRPYPWLRAQFHLERGTCYRLTGNLGEARQLYERAGNEAERSGYGVLYLRTQDHLSSVNGTAGSLSESWSRTQLALARFWSSYYPPMRGYNLYYNLYELSRMTKQPHLQMAAWRDGLALSESFSDNVLRAMAHSLMADAAMAAEQPQTAEREFARAGQLFAACPQIKSTRIDRMEAETRLGEVEVAEGKARQAVLRLQHLEPEISQLSDNLLAILFYTTLGDAESGIGDGKEAESAILSAIGLAELQLRSVNDETSRLKWSQQTSSTYRNFVQLRLRQGDAQGALEIWEWYRGASEPTGRSTNLVAKTKARALPEPHEVAARLPSITDETIVSYALLPQGMATWVYDNRGVFAHWTEGKPSGIEATAKRFRSLCSDPTSDESDLRQNARALYDLLAAAVEQHLSQDRILVVELDEGLSGMPFDALLDTQNHYLGDRGPIASSLGLYYRPGARASAPITADTSALIAAVPVSSSADDPSVLPLPDAVSEGEMVAHDFNAALVLAGNEATVDAILSQLPAVSVFHFAGHAISSPQQSGLLLFDGLLSASSLKQTPLSKLQLAVFSACDTQDGSIVGVYDADSLVRIFLRAGVPHVVASRWNVDSAATRQFMSLFYRALLDGRSVAHSIHQAQVGLRSSPGMAHPYYWSAFTAFGLA